MTKTKMAAGWSPFSFLLLFKEPRQCVLFNVIGAQVFKIIRVLKVFSGRVLNGNGKRKAENGLEVSTMPTAKRRGQDKKLNHLTFSDFTFQFVQCLSGGVVRL